MNRRRGHANGRDGLWQDTPTGPIPANELPPQLAANPLTVACPWQPCKAPPRRTCVNHRGKPRTPHPGRIEAANKPREPPMSDVELGPPKEEPDCFSCCDTGCVECDPTVQGPELPEPPRNPHADDPWQSNESPF